MKDGVFRAMLTFTPAIDAMAEAWRAVAESVNARMIRQLREFFAVPIDDAEWARNWYAHPADAWWER